MAAPKQARRPAANASTRTGARKDKGTRGGRPEAQPGGSQAPRPAGPAAQRARAQNARAQDARTQRKPPASEVAAEPAGPATRIAPTWLQLTTWVLAIGGLGVSTYLTIVHYDTSVSLVCSDKGLVNCAAVTTSAESIVFGIPVAVLGLAFYVFMVAATSPWAWRSKYPQLAWARLASVIIGIAFVLYLIYTELFTLNAICLWCTSVHVITFLLFVLIVIATAVGYGFREPDPARPR
ncbi:MAG TPA: vitamin K epoxide reductase family protein [Streptosporangiaceae bacterium]|nr:vitamin K epoxide reductase family protein [Streptosporangiaceae bacterium]